MVPSTFFDCSLYTDRYISRLTPAVQSPHYVSTATKVAHYINNTKSGDGANSHEQAVLSPALAGRRVRDRDCGGGRGGFAGGTDQQSEVEQCTCTCAHPGFGG